MRKTPKRICIVTREQFNKDELIRVVRTPDKQVIVDETGKANGRGAYLKLDKTVIAQAKKRKALDRALNVTVDDEIYEQLNELIVSE